MELFWQEGHRTSPVLDVGVERRNVSSLFLVFSLPLRLLASCPPFIPPVRKGESFEGYLFLCLSLRCYQRGRPWGARLGPSYCHEPPLPAVGPTLLPDCKIPLTTAIREL